MGSDTKLALVTACVAARWLLDIIHPEVVFTGVSGDEGALLVVNARQRIEHALSLALDGSELCLHEEKAVQGRRTFTVACGLTKGHERKQHEYYERLGRPLEVRDK